jgi:1-acyl-sn-glycerol-3-phosphate acyltransferase
MTNYERFKIFFFSVTGLLPLRLMLLFVFFAIAVFLVNVSVYGGRNRSNSPLWFFIFSSAAKLSANLMLISMGFYHFNVEGKLASRQECKLLVGNHVCMIELVYLYLAADFPAFVSAAGNLSIPLFRGIVTASDAILVDRDQASSRNKTLVEIKRRAQDLNAAQLMIFPEGTCNNQLTLFDFRKGAFEPGNPIQPICFYFPYKHFNPCWTGRAVGGNDLIDLLIRLLSQFVNRLDIRVLPVYKPTEEEKADSLLYAKNVQRRIAEEIGLSTSTATYADYATAARKFNKEFVVNSVADSPALTPRQGQHPPKQALSI